MATATVTKILGANAGRFTAVVCSPDPLPVVGVGTVAGTVDPVTGVVAETTANVDTPSSFTVGVIDGGSYIPLARCGDSSGLVILEYTKLGRIMRGELHVKQGSGSNMSVTGTDIYFQSPIEY